MMMFGDKMFGIDENGRIVILVKDQEKKTRLSGKDFLKSNIQAAKSVALTLRTSLGPKGLYKLLVTTSEEVVVTHDGATILKMMDIEHQIAKLMVQLAKSQDDEIGDGTTGVVVLAGALLQEAEYLLDVGIHPGKIADGYESASRFALAHLDEISVEMPYSLKERESLIKTAKTTLRSKCVNDYLDLFAEIAVEAVLSVADFERKDVNLDMIRIFGKEGRSLEESRVFRGVVIEKGFSHPQMPKQLKDARVAIFNSPFEISKPQGKYSLTIKDKEDFLRLRKYEEEKYIEMIEKVKASGADVVFCQHGFDEEANHLLLKYNLPAVRWVMGSELEALAICTKANIISRINDISEDKLGRAGKIFELPLGLTKAHEHLMMIEECPNESVVTILICGSNSFIIEEAKRSVHDAICAIRTLIRDSRIVFGGGASEISCAIAVEKQSNTLKGIEQRACKSFADALESIPEALANNSGLQAMEAIARAKSKQVKDNSSSIGIDCMNEGHNDMSIQNVFEPLLSKKQQISLATQVVRMILKIDEVFNL